MASKDKRNIEHYLIAYAQHNANQVTPNYIVKIIDVLPSVWLEQNHGETTSLYHCEKIWFNHHRATRKKKADREIRKSKETCIVM